MTPHVFCNGADKMRGVRIHVQAFIDRHGQQHRQGQQLANRYIEGKADEYSNKRTWSSISEQYPEGLTRGVIQVRGRRSGTRPQDNTKRLD